jgi:hypothetical protein
LYLKVACRDRAFADDIILHGDAERLLGDIDDFKQIIYDATGTVLCLR